MKSACWLHPDDEHSLYRLKWFEVAEALFNHCLSCWESLQMFVPAFGDAEAAIQHRHPTKARVMSVENRDAGESGCRQEKLSRMQRRPSHHVVSTVITVDL